MLLQLHDLHLSFFDKLVFQGVSLTVHPGDRIALVGENGSGKTTLFRVILGAVKPDRGDVAVRTGCSIGYLEQEAIAASGEAETTCLDAALAAFSHLLALEARIDQLNHALAQSAALFGHSGMEQLLGELGEAMAAYEAGGGYTYRARAEATLQGLGLSPEAWSKPVAALSSGQRARLALARLLLGRYDVLLLDEPTNHLDAGAREWLAGALRELDAAYVVASHDRRFLDEVATKVAHLDRGSLTVYPGNYTQFQRQRQEAAETAWRTYEKRQKLVRKLEEQARAYKSWSGAKESAKRGAADKGFVSARAARLAKRAIAAERRLVATIQRLKTDKPFEPDQIAIEFHGGRGGLLVWARDLAVGYDPGAPLAAGIRLALSAGQRIGVAGPNGCGKSTLLKTLVGEISPLAGEFAIGASVSVGYFDQEMRRLPGGVSAVEAVLETGKDVTLVRTVLGRMRLRKESTLKAVSDLSGGERAKVLLARLILGDHDVLVLDEPTNHLDLETQDVLLEALAEFPGGIVFVSHDRYFFESLATETLRL